MKSFKYRLSPEGSECSYGTTDLRPCLGCPIEVEGCVVLMCTEGVALFSIDFHNYTFRRGDLLVVMYDRTVIPLKVSAGFRVEWVSLSLSVCNDTFYKISSVKFWDRFYFYPVCRLEPEHQRLVESWLLQVKWIARHTEDTYRTELLQSVFYQLMLSLCCEMERLSLASGKSEKRSHAWVVANDFMVLVGRHYVKHRDVAYYATRLCVSPDYLNKLSLKYILMTPKEYINRQCIMAIKTYLSSTDLSVKNIANELNYEDASYLCRFFRRMTGMSPLEYRERLGKP